MGNKQSSTQSKFYPPTQQHQLQILYECEQGQVVQSTLNSKQYLIRQLSFGNSQSMQKLFDELKEYETENKSGMLINLLNIEKRSYNNMCGSQNRVRLIFEYSMLSINDEIEERKSKLQYFDLNDCYRIMIGSFRAIQQVQMQYNKYPKLVQNSILNRVFAQPQRILLMQNGLVKLCNPLIISTYDRFQHKQNCYYSPEKLSDFDFAQDSKSMIFQLGITLIHIFLLKDSKDIYNGFQVKQDTIDNKILQIWNIYSDVMLCEMLSKMTRTYRNMRIDLEEGIGLVGVLQERLMDRLGKEISEGTRGRASNQILIQDDRDQMQDQTYRQGDRHKHMGNHMGNSNHQYCISTYSNKHYNYPSNIKSNYKQHKQPTLNNDPKHVSLSQFDNNPNPTKLNTKSNNNLTKDISQTNNILSSRLNNIRISTYNNNNKKQTNNSLCIFDNHISNNNININILQNTKKDIDVSNMYNNMGAQMNKQNIMKYCNTLSNIGRLDKSYRIGSQLNIRNSQSNNDSSGVIKERYNGISNYNYMYDCYSNHQPLPIGVAIEDKYETVNQNNQQLYIKQTESIIRYKESYQYGQHLTEGLYTREANADKKVSANNFEWKRTQFNKKSNKKIENHSISRKSKNSYYISNYRDSASNTNNHNLSFNLATSKYVNVSQLDIDCQDLRKSKQGNP